MVDSLLHAVVILFPVSEITLAAFKRSRSPASDVRDSGSMALLWVVIGVSVALAVVLQSVRAAAMQAPAVVLGLTALALMIVGLTVRWVSILTLGRLFTVDVAVQSDHGLVETGPYRYVRHPSYSGLLLAFLGLGVFFANWLSLFVVVLPITLAVLRRIGIEERVLRDALAPQYDAYCSRTKRLVPGLF